ncbi:MAG: hypothetical protein HYY65_08855 [Candidatus Tectomicrobia bacterium]|uniref:PDZ domain-containing protein n=1 Tax=Tectimicrobiota bacterium TaxID=2528274 RepID=A0A932GQM1_UNCTE|nr:hypothetical protein [Candidatus Tectomicrobia bacterium]
MKAILSLLILLTLIGCAAPPKVMISARGRQVRCGSFGFGVIGTTVAVGSYLECVNQQKALGFVDLEDFERTEAPKVEQRMGVSPSKVGRPLWETGYVWTYQLSGIRSGTSRQEVIGKELAKGLTAYVVKFGENKLLLSEDLQTIQVQEKDKITATHTPPLQSYAWPLEVGKTWQSKGEMETQTGKINTSTNFEVKGYGVVRVPAGEFEAFYLLSTSDFGARVSEAWYSPKVRRHVKLVNYMNEGWIIAELTGFSLAPEGHTPPSAPAQLPSPSAQASAPTPSVPASPTQPLAKASPPTAPVPPTGPWLGVPLGSPDQQTLERVGLRPGRGAVVLPFARNPDLPPIDLDPGDVIVAIDGIDLEGPGHVAALLASKSAGSTVLVKAFRGQYQRQIEQPMVILRGRP